MSTLSERMEAILEQLRVNDPEAMENLRCFAEENPDYPDAWAHYAWNLFYRGYGEEAYKAARQLVQLMPTVPDAFQLLSRVCFRLGYVDESVQSMQRAVSMAPEPFPFQTELLETFLRLGRPFSALRLYRRLRTNQVQGRQISRRTLSRILANLGIVSTAKIVFIPAIRDALFFRLYRYFADKKRWSEAYVLARGAATASPHSPEWAERTAEALYQKREFLFPEYDTEIVWRHIAFRNGAHQAMEKLARVNLHAGYATTAISMLDKNPPHTVEGKETYAHALTAVRRYEEAEKLYAKLGEHDHIHFANAGIVCLFTKEYLRAQMLFDDTLRMNPSSPLAAFLQRIVELKIEDKKSDAQELDSQLQELAQKHKWQDRIGEYRDDWEKPKERLLQTEKYQTISCPLCGSSNFQPTYLDPVPQWIRGQCKDCEFLYANPQPLPETIGELYLDEAAQGSPLQQFFRRSLDEILSQPPEEAGKMFGRKERFWEPEFSLPRFEDERGNGRRMLDVGCSVGTTMLQYRCRGWQVAGIDLDDQAVDLAKSLDLDARVATIEDAAFEKESFDLITMMDVIEHVPDPKPIFRKLYDLLKPGGILKLKTPCAESIVHYLYGPQWISSDTHLIYFSRRKLLETLQQFGFHILATRSYLEVNKLTHTYDSWRRLSVTPLFDRLVIDLDIGDTIMVLGVK